MKSDLSPVLDGPVEVGGLTLRPFTFGSLALCRQLGLTMFTDEPDEGDDSLSEGELQAKYEKEFNEGVWQNQIATFLWIQSQPVDDVLRTVRDDTWEAAVERFQWDLEIAKMPEYLAEVRRISSGISEFAVDVLPKGDDGEDDTPGKS